MSWSVPERIKLKMVHSLEVREEIGLVRTRVRETSCVVRRPEHGEARVALECRHCKRQGVFVIQDRETTQELRRRPVIRSLITAFVLIATVVCFAVVGFGGGSILFQVLTIPAGLILLPLGIVFAVSPSANIGVTNPKDVFFKGKTKRDGLTYVTESARHREGVSCVSFSEPAR